MSDAPTEIRLAKDRASLAMTFGDGARYQVSAELLRVESPSAEVQGHGPGQKQIVPGKQAVLITGIEPIGHYAIRIMFSDGHDTGYYTWRYLRELGENGDALLTAYRAALAARGLAPR